MPIKVQCACGKAFAAKDELAGKTVKCPGCQKPLKIPAAEPAKAAAAKSPAAKPAAAPAKKPAPSTPSAAATKPAATGGGSSNVYDEIGLQKAEAGTRPCPGCTAPMPIEAVICVKCGYNARIGRRMETVREGGSGEVGHGAVATDLLARAATVMDADAEEERKKTRSGMPWWVYLIGILLLMGLATYMLLYWAKEEPKDEKKKGMLRDVPVIAWRTDECAHPRQIANWRA